MRTVRALHLSLAAAVMLAGCANSGRLGPAVTSAPAATPARAVESGATGAAPVAAAARTEAVAQEAPEAIGRLVVTQGTATVSVVFRDGALADLRAPSPNKVSQRAREGAELGAYAGFAGAVGGMFGFYLLALTGGAVGAAAGTIVGGVEEAVGGSNIPREKIALYAPVLESAATDLARGPRPVSDCVAAELGAAPAPTGDVANLAALARDGYSHVLTLDASEIAFVQEPPGDSRSDHQARFAAKLAVRYSLHKLATADDPPRVVHVGQSVLDAPAMNLDRWAAAQGREVRELAARGCPLLAAKIGTDLSARFALAPR